MVVSSVIWNFSASEAEADFLYHLGVKCIVTSEQLDKVLSLIHVVTSVHNTSFSEQRSLLFLSHDEGSSFVWLRL